MKSTETIFSLKGNGAIYRQTILPVTLCTAEDLDVENSTYSKGDSPMKSSGRTQPKPTHGLSLEFQNSYFTSLDVSSFLYLLHLMHFQRLCMLLKNKNHTQKKKKEQFSFPASLQFDFRCFYLFLLRTPRPRKREAHTEPSRFLSASPQRPRPKEEDEDDDEEEDISP